MIGFITRISRLVVIAVVTIGVTQSTAFALTQEELEKEIEIKKFFHEFRIAVGCISLLAADEAFRTKPPTGVDEETWLREIGCLLLPNVLPCTWLGNKKYRGQWFGNYRVYFTDGIPSESIWMHPSEIKKFQFMHTCS